MTVKSIELYVDVTTSDAVWQLCGEKNCLHPLPGSTMRSEVLAGSKKVTLTATLGDKAKRKAKLMLATKDKPEAGTKLRMVVKLQ